MQSKRDIHMQGPEAIKDQEEYQRRLNETLRSAFADLWEDINQGNVRHRLSTAMPSSGTFDGNALQLVVSGGSVFLAARVSNSVYRMGLVKV